MPLVAMGAPWARWAASLPMWWLALPAAVLTAPSFVAMALRTGRPWLRIGLVGVVAAMAVFTVSLPEPWANPAVLWAVLATTLGGSALFTAAVVR